jgi:hypothetical protein
VQEQVDDERAHRGRGHDERLGSVTHAQRLVADVRTLPLDRRRREVTTP